MRHQACVSTFGDASRPTHQRARVCQLAQVLQAEAAGSTQPRVPMVKEVTAPRGRWQVSIDKQLPCVKSLLMSRSRTGCT